MNKLPVTQDGPFDLTRRDFVRNSSFAAAMLAMGGVPLFADDKKEEVTNLDANAILSKVKVGIIGCGVWGREIINLLGRLPRAELIAVCDTYEPFLKRGKEAAPKAEAFTDYKKIIDNKDVQAVIIATPSHLHTKIALEAMAAGKHVYCEAPLATTIEDARTIARAARDNPKVYFQVGQLMRSHAHRQFLWKFIRSGAAGTPVLARAQWHKKQSWRRTSPNPEREKQINWRLDKATSIGLVGEIGIQQIDTINWLLGRRPTAVTGFGSIALWDDGRTVDDTVQAIFEYEGGSTFSYQATLANSFDSEYEVIYGVDAAVMARGVRAWMFKEVDAPLLGWEVYARKEVFFEETGIALVADATKSVKKDGAGAGAAPVDPPIYFALDAFLINADMAATAIEDYAATFNVNDTKALREYVAGQMKTKAPAAGYQEGYESAVVVIKANEAIQKRQRLPIDKQLFEI
jgi:predicted dehydrogenase